MTFLKTIPSCVVGIDVSKAMLVVCEQGKQQVHEIANSLRSIRQFLSHQEPGLFVVLEPTGGYEALLVREVCA